MFAIQSNQNVGYPPGPGQDVHMDGVGRHRSPGKTGALLLTSKVKSLDGKPNFQDQDEISVIYTSYFGALDNS